MTSQPYQNVNNGKRKRGLDDDDDPQDIGDLEGRRMKMMKKEENTCPGGFPEDFLRPGTRGEERKSSRSARENLSGVNEIAATCLRSEDCSGDNMMNCLAQAAIKWTCQDSFEPGEGGNLELQ